MPTCQDTGRAAQLPYGFMTHHMQWRRANHGFTHWWTMFNPRQLLVHAQLLKAIRRIRNYDWNTARVCSRCFPAVPAQPEHVLSSGT